MLDDENGNPSGKQLMVLWSTKDNPKVMVSGTEWTRLKGDQDSINMAEFP